tara:strand:- start:3253 stop:4140 length:888 start_codon:yes stop_codon:yes gene_type:complete
MINTHSKEAHMLFGENHRAIMNLRNQGYGDAGFDIRTVPLYYNVESDNDIVTNGWKSKKYTTYRTDTGEELGVHGERYHAIRPSQMIDTCRNLLERSDLPCKNIIETIQTSHTGSRTFVKYTLPEVTYDTGDGDNATLGLLATTSFDSTWSFMISVAAVQSACLNLQVFMSGDVAIYKSRHTKGINLEAGSRIVSSALDVFNNERGLWIEWQNTLLQSADIKRTLEVLPKSAQDYIRKQLKDVYAERFGYTLWAFYNALTDWSTHAPISKRSVSNIASIRNLRQRKVREVFKWAA